MIHRHPRRGARIGATLVETAVVISIALLFMFGIFEYGRYVMFRQLVENAARAGARQAIAGTSNATTADIQATVTQNMAGQQLTAQSIAVYKADPYTGANLGAWNGAKFGEGIAVEVTGTFKPMLPTLGIMPSTVAVKAKAVMRSEGN
jgi:Flp pilus assembly protein TadG